MPREIYVISLVGQNQLKTPMDRLNLSARAYDRILKVSRTIAGNKWSEEYCVSIFRDRC